MEYTCIIYIHIFTILIWINLSSIFIKVSIINFPQKCGTSYLEFQHSQRSMPDSQKKVGKPPIVCIWFNRDSYMCVNTYIYICVTKSIKSNKEFLYQHSRLKTIDNGEVICHIKYNNFIYYLFIYFFLRCFLCLVFFHFFPI